MGGALGLAARVGNEDDAVTIHEHRRTMVAPGRFEDYRALMLDQVWGGLEDAGYRPLCFLSIFIGGTPEETHTPSSAIPRGMNCSAARSLSAASAISLAAISARPAASWS